jgi:hypothetical protein
MINLEQDLYKDILALTELNVEIWRDVKGFLGIYQISNLGNVRNVKTLRILKFANSSGYEMVKLYRKGEVKNLFVHRLLSLAFIPNPKNKTCIDHINNKKLDNRLKNLRFVTSQENSRNRSISSHNTSGVKGISFHTKCNKWQAFIKINGKMIYIGIFTDIEEAKEARQKKAKELFGEYINKCEL